MNNADRAMALGILFDTLEGHIRRNTREKALETARLIRGMCFEFLDYIDLSHPQRLALDGSVQTEYLHGRIEKLGARLLKEGCPPRKLASTIRERWLIEKLPKPVRSIKTIRRALENLKL